MSASSTLLTCVLVWEKSDLASFVVESAVVAASAISNVDLAFLYMSFEPFVLITYFNCSISLNLGKSFSALAIVCGFSSITTGFVTCFSLT